jgi:hypothetical protein
MREALANHELKCIAEDGKVQVWSMRRPNDSAFRVQVSFSPEGIAIQGDIGFGPNQGGICSDMGYGLNWFGCKKSESYLCEKFLREIWQPRVAKRDIADRLKQAREDFEKAVPVIIEEYIDLYGGEVDEAEVRSDPTEWGLDDEHKEVEGWKALYSWSEEDGPARLAELGSEHFEDFWDYGIGQDFPISDAAWLCAVQQRFVELYQVILKECEADGAS